MWENIFLELLRHRGKIIGLLIGLLFAYLVIRHGFLITLLLAFVYISGLLLGNVLMTMRV